MTTAPLGMFCDICGTRIKPDQTFITFRVHMGLEFGEDMHSHTGKCEASFREAQETGDWRKLLKGPLRTLYEQASTE